MVENYQNSDHFVAGSSHSTSKSETNLAYTYGGHMSDGLDIEPAGQVSIGYRV